MTVIRLAPGDLSRVAEIDRSEVVRHAYQVMDGELRRLVVHWDVPTWPREGTGEHSLHAVLAEWQPVVDGDGVLLGVEGETGLAGIAIVVPGWQPGVAWLAFLYVDRSARRRGVAAALWAEAERLAREAGAGEMVVSAVPSGPAMDFYLSRGCVLPAEPHPALVAKEPEDIQLVKWL